MIIPTTPVSGQKTQSKSQRREPQTGGDQRFAKALSDLVAKPSSHQKGPTTDRYDRSEVASGPRPDRPEHSADLDRSTGPTDRTRTPVHGEQPRAESTDGDTANDHGEGMDDRTEEAGTAAGSDRNQIDGDQPVSDGQVDPKDSSPTDETDLDARVDAASTETEGVDEEAADESDSSTTPPARGLDGAAATIGLAAPTTGAEAKPVTSEPQTGTTTRTDTVDPSAIDRSDPLVNPDAGEPVTSGLVPASAENDSDNTSSPALNATAETPAPTGETQTAVEAADPDPAAVSVTGQPAQEPVSLPGQTGGESSATVSAPSTDGTNPVEQTPADEAPPPEVELDEANRAGLVDGEDPDPAATATADTATTAIGQAVAASAAASPAQPDGSNGDSDVADTASTTATTATTGLGPRTGLETVTGQTRPPDTDQPTSDDTGQPVDSAPDDAGTGPEPANEAVSDVGQPSGPGRAAAQTPSNPEALGQPAPALRSAQGPTTAAPDPLPGSLVELANTGLAERLRPAFSAIHRSIDGMDELKLRIQEQGGAPIKVSISTSEETVRVVLSSTNNNLMSELGQGRQKLADELRRAGFTQTSIDVQSDGPNQNNDSRQPTQTSRIDNRFDYDEAYDTDRASRVGATPTRGSRGAGVDLDL